MIMIQRSIDKLTHGGLKQCVRLLEKHWYTLLYIIYSKQ